MVLKAAEFTCFYLASSLKLPVSHNPSHIDIYVYIQKTIILASKS